MKFTCNPITTHKLPCIKNLMLCPKFTLLEKDWIVHKLATNDSLFSDMLDGSVSSGGKIYSMGYCFEGMYRLLGADMQNRIVEHTGEVAYNKRKSWMKYSTEGVKKEDWEFWDDE